MRSTTGRVFLICVGGGGGGRCLWGAERCFRGFGALIAWVQGVECGVRDITRRVRG